MNAEFPSPLAGLAGTTLGGASCGLCGFPLLEAASSPRCLCPACRTDVQSELARRSAEIRSCIDVLKTSSIPDQDAYERAKAHLQELASLEQRGLVALRPGAAALLANLERLHQEYAARVQAGQEREEIRDQRPLVDWVNETAPTGRAFSSLVCPVKPGNRRRHPRHRIALRAFIQPLGVEGQVRDISQEGIAVECTMYRSAGSLVRLTFETSRGLVVVQGIVRRAERLKGKKSGSTVRLGIHLTRGPEGFLSTLLG